MGILPYAAPLDLMQASRNSKAAPDAIPHNWLDFG
jgi:hypothetical protein